MLPSCNVSGWLTRSCVVFCGYGVFFCVGGSCYTDRRQQITAAIAGMTALLNQAPTISLLSHATMCYRAHLRCVNISAPESTARFAPYECHSSVGISVALATQVAVFVAFLDSECIATGSTCTFLYETRATCGDFRRGMATSPRTTCKAKPGVEHARPIQRSLPFLVESLFGRFCFRANTSHPGI